MIAGQGTVMLVSINQVADLDNVLTPVVSGGLNSGLCLAAQTLLPRWPSLPLSRPAPWMRWTGLGQAESYRSHAQLEYACPDRPSNESWGANPPDFPSAHDEVLWGWTRGNSTGNAIRL